MKRILAYVGILAYFPISIWGLWAFNHTLYGITTEYVEAGILPGKEAAYGLTITFLLTFMVAFFIIPVLIASGFDSFKEEIMNQQTNPHQPHRLYFTNLPEPHNLPRFFMLLRKQKEVKRGMAATQKIQRQQLR